MNKKILLLIAFILSLGMLLVSCGGTTEPTACTEHTDADGDGICDTEGCGEAVTSPDASADAFDENGNLILFKDGVATFQFVMSTDTIGKHKGDVEDLALVLDNLAECDPIKTVTQNAPEKTVEILIGTITNRGEQYNINRYDYGNTGYAVKIIGTKIIVTGGSDKAVTSALSYLKTNFFGIKKNTAKFETFSVSAEKNYDVKQTNYTLKEITIAGNNIKDYVITHPVGDDTAATNAYSFQTKLYDTCGIRLEVFIEANVDSSKQKIAFRTLKNDAEGGGFYVRVEENKDLSIECEFKSRSIELTTEYLANNLFNKKTKYAFAADYSYTPNYRDIYYKDFGAVGDGKTDDFFAIKAAHDAANADLLNVHADSKATYYIGNANGSQSIIVKTNTYWHGCNFIFDDEVVGYTTACATTPIFIFERDNIDAEYTQETSPVKSLEAGAANIGWAPGFEAMVLVYNKNVRHYIRSGANASQTETAGSDMHELIIVDKDGNVDPSTPVQWTYDVVTKLIVYPVNDRPIEVKGEDDAGNLATFTTHYNDGPSAYWYYERNLFIRRSNMVISGVEHVIDNFTPESEGGHGSPYHGFTYYSQCNNVVVENFIFQWPTTYTDKEPILRPAWMPNITNGGMGSYEINAEISNNVTWRNCSQSNFFEPDGTVIFKGPTGSNFCKNLTYDNVSITSFDAHQGVYNGTIKNSTLEHINYIGAGTITLENVTLYADGWMHSVINLRDDYGSTWDGDVIIDGLTIKMRTMDEIGRLELHREGGIRIFQCSWNNWFYGYTTYLPRNITIKNLLVEEYDVYVKNGVRFEEHVAYNSFDVRIYKSNISSAGEDYYRDDYIDGKENVNKMVPTENIYYFTEYTGEYAKLDIGEKEVLNLIFPYQNTTTGGSTMFRDTKFYVDGELITCLR